MDEIIQKQTERDFAEYCKTRLKRNPATICSGERDGIIETMEYKNFELKGAFNELRSELINTINNLLNHFHNEKTR